MVDNNPLIRPYFFEGVALGGGALRFPCVLFTLDTCRYCNLG